MGFSFLESLSTIFSVPSFILSFLSYLTRLLLAFSLSHYTECNKYSVNLRFFISFSKACLWAPAYELWLFGKLSSPSCYSNTHFGLSSLFHELKLTIKLTARVFCSKCIVKSAYCLITSLSVLLLVPLCLFHSILLIFILFSVWFLV